MNILVIGSGGREHALAWKLAQSPKVARVVVAPGNAGTAQEAKVENLDLTHHQDLIDFCRREDIAFTVVGPEAPLAAGIADDFERAGLKIFGPSRYCAQLESSKDFAKAFMQQHGIPTAAHQTFSDAAAAHAYINERPAPIVIKADGLAAGKGVVVAQSQEEAHAAVDAMLLEHSLGQAGARVVIEDFLQGEEASFIVMVDGQDVLPLATSQDHKRLLEGDAGPNTGGMGAYSPAPIVTPDVHERVMARIILPSVRALAAQGHPYRGFLYAGLMIDAQGEPYTVEFNCRFGDPETQPVLSRLESDLVEALEAVFSGSLKDHALSWSSEVALGVVAAADGYPAKPRLGDAVTCEASAPPGKIFHAGTRLDNGKPVTSGGRVLCAVGLGADIVAARKAAYRLLDTVHFAGMHYRRDIGARALGGVQG